MSSWTVINPGTHPAPKWIAAELSVRRRLGAYVTGFQFADDESPYWARLNRSWGAEFQKRRLPSGVLGRAVVRVGSVRDVGAAVSLRLGHGSLASALLRSRNRSIARVGVGEALDANNDGVLFPTGTGSDVAQALVAAGVPYSLYTPLPSIPFAKSILESEAEKNPAWSRFLTSARYSAREVDQSAFEVEHASKIIANSTFTAESYRSMAGAAVIDAVPLAVDVRRVRDSVSSPQPPQRVPSSPLKVAYLGQLTQRKGLSYLFEAVSQAADDVPVELHLVGSDPLGMADALVSAYPSVEAVFHGRLSQAASWEVLVRCHLFVFPTLLDGFGNALAEALALGLPAIATERTGAPDLGWTTGADAPVKLVRAADSSALAAELVRFADADYREAAASEAARRVVSRSWNDYAAEVADLL
jgi:glycosyltransferase involved in cell wall biosynthesis